MTDSVASMLTEKLSSHITRMDLKQVLTENSFIEVYEDLLYNKGFGHIKSIHLHPRLGNTYEIAKSAAKKVSEEHITVINSRTNGLGLGLLIPEIDHAIEQELPPHEI